ncbi:AEC family transporter [Deltaproteobacteria bacterium OttesenSCG-928-K17]|nr:AEC family transporter [Deltaproteobacteria bacterium OttesenSCG-928-K17]
MPWAEVIGRAANAVLSLFLMGLVGYILARRNWFTDESKALVPRLVTVIALPPYLFVNILTTFNRGELAGLIYGVAVPALSIIGAALISMGLIRLLKVRPGRRGLFMVGITCSNTMFIGLPVNITLFGMDALPYVLLYFFANTVFFWTLGNYSLSLDGPGKAAPLLSLQTVKRVLSPPLCGFFLGLLLVTAEMRPPEFFMSAAAYIGSLTTPLAIIFIGATLATVSLKELKPDRDIIVVMLGRFVLSPLLVIGLTRIFTLPPLMAKVFIIQSSLPMVASAGLMAGYYKSDVAFASVSVSLSTILSMATIPLYMIIISLLNF